jgi:DNA-binding NarL/FixJ family response regulator
MPGYTTLIIDDFENFRGFVLSALQQRAEFKIIYQAADGLDGVQQATELKPDLILVDIGLPKLNGIEVARRIRKVSPNSKILFFTQESSPDVVQEALNAGAHGYVAKVDAGKELLPAVYAVLQGKQFISSGLRPPASARDHEHTVHELASYRDNATLVKDFVRFIEAALRAGNPAIVIATESHRTAILDALQARLDMTAAIKEGRFVSLDARDTISTFMVNDHPDSVKVSKAVRDLVSKAAQVAKCARPRVAACGEMGPMLLASGNGDAAIELEHLTFEIAKSCDVDILCGYVQKDIQAGNSNIFEKICAEHSAVYHL